LLEGDKVASVQHFDANKDNDELYRWSARRSSYVATANVALAKMAYTDSGNGGGGCFSGCWGYNSAFGMYSFLPFGGMAYSPFGYPFWSPYQSFYAPYYYYPSGSYPVIASSSRPTAPVRGLPVVGGGRTAGGFAQSTASGSGRGSSSGFSVGHAASAGHGGHR
jgi:hypothetical protein